MTVFSKEIRIKKDLIRLKTTIFLGNRLKTVKNNSINSQSLNTRMVLMTSSKLTLLLVLIRKKP